MIEYTHHARKKFEILERYGFSVSPDQVQDVVDHPERVIPQSEDRFIAQKKITERHVLRVVYRKEGNARIVITFYPGRRVRYED